MNWDIRWEPLEMQVQAQIARLVEDVLRNPERNSGKYADSLVWAPVVDLSKLRPN
jgi:hypothetical protein